MFPRTPGLKRPFGVIGWAQRRGNALQALTLNVCQERDDSCTGADAPGPARNRLGLLHGTSPARSVPAVATGAAENDLVRRDAVSAATGDAGDCLLEGGILERLDLAAVSADEVVVMLSGGIGALEAGDAVAEVDALHEAGLVEALEGAVHARDPDPHAAGAYAVVDLLRRDAALPPAEELDHHATRAAAATRLGPQADERRLHPDVAHGR